ncbi:hypothetical protein IGI04_037549, partial [Brassica rapa subsp. trilocularis]
SKVWGNSIFVITADEQVKGYGTRLMNHLKQHARDVDRLTHFLAHAQQCCWLFKKKMVNHSPERECEIPGDHALWKSGVVRIRTRVLWGSTEQISGGFTKELYLEKDVRNGFIKDHDGGLLMECKIDQKLPYTDLSCMIRQQRKLSH